MTTSRAKSVLLIFDVQVLFTLFKIKTNKLFSYSLYTKVLKL